MLVSWDSLPLTGGWNFQQNGIIALYGGAVPQMKLFCPATARKTASQNFRHGRLTFASMIRLRVAYAARRSSYEELGWSRGH